MTWDSKYMARALELAAMGLGRTSPNPAVGAVVVKDGKVIGEGYHKKAGTAHAEVIALTAAGQDARGADLYVTLEPCSHQGRTPPCTEAVIAAGIKRVAAATTDPNPMVSGQGIDKLQAAGIEVTVGMMEKQARRLNEFFFKYITTGLPFVALKTAMTLDGKIAARTGDSKWITNELSREYVHQLRDTYDAILVGIGTVLQDDPRLNTRLDKEEARDPVRIIIDSGLALPLDSQIVATAREQRTMVFYTEAPEGKAEKLREMGVEVIRTSNSYGRVDLAEVLGYAAQQEIMSILIEGGSGIYTCALEQNLVDKVYWFIAPKICGGKDALAPVAGVGVEYMKNALELKETEVRQLGSDILVTGYLNQERR